MSDIDALARALVRGGSGGSLVTRTPKQAVVNRWSDARAEETFLPDGASRWVIWVPTPRGDYQAGWGSTEGAAWRFTCHDFSLSYDKEAIDHV